MMSTRSVAVNSPLGSDKLLFRKMQGEESLAQLFELKLDLLSDDPQISLTDLLGEALSIRLSQAGGERFFHGVVSEFSFGGSHQNKFLYHATLRPWLWLLTRTTDCRIFQNLSTPDIIKEILREHGFTDFEERLSQDYPPREYCVQYRESDYDFIARLLEDEGISYFFEHEESRHLCVFSDANENYAPLQPTTLPYHPPSQNAIRDEEHIFDWRVTREVRSGHLALNAYDFQKPKAGLEVKASNPPPHSQGEHEQFDYPGGYDQTDAGDRLARLRLEETQCGGEVVRGECDVSSIAVGKRFTLSGYPREDQNKEYLITSITHQLHSELYESGTPDREIRYHASFRGLDFTLPFRPRRVTPTPRVDGPQTATVVGQEGEELWVDEYGRVKVQFHWDRRGASDENSSCWVRVATPSAGKNFGVQFLPQVGQEVIVDFLEGDPDRPLLTGRLHNADNMPPDPLPENKYRSIIRDEFGHELVFDRTPGNEHIRLHSPNHTSTLEVGRSIVASTDSDNRSLTLGESTVTAIGATNELFVGARAEEVLGAQASLFLGASLDAFLGSSVGLALGGRFDAGMEGSVSWMGGSIYTISENENVTHSDEQIMLDSAERIYMIGGPDDSAVVQIGFGDPAVGAERNNQISLSFHPGGTSDADDMQAQMRRAAIRNYLKWLASSIAAGGAAAAVGAAVAMSESSQDKTKETIGLAVTAGVTGLAAILGGAHALNEVRGLGDKFVRAPKQTSPQPKSSVVLDDRGITLTMNQNGTDLATVNIATDGKISFDTSGSGKNIEFNAGAGDIVLNGNVVNMVGAKEMQVGGGTPLKTSNITDKGGPKTSAAGKASSKRSAPKGVKAKKSSGISKSKSKNPTSKPKP